MNKEETQKMFLELLEKSEQRVSKTNAMVEKFAEASERISQAAININEMSQRLNSVSNDHVARLQEDIRSMILNCEKKDDDMRNLIHTIKEKDAIIADMRKRLDRLTDILAAFAGNKKDASINISNQ